MRRVLIIESERFLLELLKRRFERGGFQVLATPQLLQGLALAREGRPDLIILDRRLKEADGGLSELLCSVPETAAIPLILLGPSEVEAVTVPSPALDKPFSPGQLLALAHVYLDVCERTQFGGQVGIVPIS